MLQYSVTNYLHFLPYSYQMVEDINLQLQEMGSDIKSVIDRVNQANANQDENSPVSDCSVV